RQGLHPCLGLLPSALAPQRERRATEIPRRVSADVCSVGRFVPGNDVSHQSPAVETRAEVRLQSQLICTVSFGSHGGTETMKPLIQRSAAVLAFGIVTVLFGAVLAVPAFAQATATFNG